MGNLFDKKLGEKIRELREQKELSQQDLADKMGISRTILPQIEKGGRTIKAEEIAKLAKIFNINANSLLDMGKEPEVIIEKDKEIARESKEGIRINVPQKNIDKFKQVLLYILNRVSSKPNVGESVIYKLLYFIDFNFYEKYEKQLIGATYIKNTYGPTPIEFRKVVEQMEGKGLLTKVKNEFFKYPQTKYLPRKEADLSGLQANELQLIDKVLEKLSDMTASQISEYSHKDVPWLTTEDGKKIEYESVFYRAIPYSAGKYNEDIQ